MCYEYNIPGETQWWLVPAYANPVAESCAVRPGCAYAVLLTAHPWDGRSQVEKVVQLDECVSGVCSCAHSPRLPAPVVSASTVVMHGEIFVNVTWTLPKPRFPQRLPRDLKKHNYLVSIGKQMVTDAHPAPWFANTITRPVDADGLVADGDGTRWVILPITERSLARGPSESRGGSSIVLDVKLLARVNLMDDRGCVGPAGNATAYDPSEARKIQFSTYLLWAIFGGLCVLAMVALFAMSSRIVKRILSALRPAAPAPLSPLRHRPAWFTLQFRSTIMGLGGFFNSSLVSCCDYSSTTLGSQIRKSTSDDGEAVLYSVTAVLLRKMKYDMFLSNPNTSSRSNYRILLIFINSINSWLKYDLVHTYNASVDIYTSSIPLLWKNSCRISYKLRRKPIISFLSFTKYSFSFLLCDMSFI
ncbi:hypothetical protein ABMA27_016769 [Loxostege sticticalis]|uniref:Uncharacterized protein n=1 Tax=Loxostege sticticalis TaxID=481309 RepID=A0ABR3I3J4_LOXSC